MRVFITGGTGWVGSGIIRELRGAGHSVTALARGTEAAEKLEVAGATVRRGDLTDLPGLRSAATEADAVVHCAFNHKFALSDLVGSLLVRLTGSPYFARVSRAGGTDLRAIEAIVDGLAAAPRKASKAFISTSGIALLPSGRVGTEHDAAVTSSVGSIRVASERAVVAAARRGVRSAVIRLPPSVHGAGGDTGFLPTLIDIARRTGVSGYLGAGENRWPAVHRDDAATLYRVAMEKLASGAVPGGSVLHGVAEAGLPFREIAGAIASRLELGPPEPRKSRQFGFLSMFVALDNPASAAITQELTGWQPTRPGLLDDVRSAAYEPKTLNQVRSVRA